MHSGPLAGTDHGFERQNTKSIRSLKSLLSLPSRPSLPSRRSMQSMLAKQYRHAPIIQPHLRPLTNPGQFPPTNLSFYRST